MAIPLVGKLLKKIAPKIGATVVLEPRYQVVGQITYSNGRRRYFRTSTLDINTMGASAIAKDKDYAAFFMKRMGYSTVPGQAFYSPEWARVMRSKRTVAAALAYARRLGYPVFVKPNSGTRGIDVTLVHTPRELRIALTRIFKKDDIALVQKRIIGTDYRVVVLDDRIISAYKRIPLSVVGDGRATIATLLKRKKRSFDRANRDTVIDMTDPRIKAKLKRQGLFWRSVLQNGRRVYLLDNANLSSGGDAVDVTKSVHSDFKKLAIRLTRDMGLRLCGVDLMIDGDISHAPKKYWILEVNSAPGLDHYAESGARQQKMVENLYLKVLRDMAH